MKTHLIWFALWIGILLPAHAQAPYLMRQNTSQIIERWFQDARAQREATQVNQVQQEISNSLNPRAQRRPVPNRNSSVKSSSTRPWQLAIFLGEEPSQRNLDNLFSILKERILKNQVQWAVVFDMFHCQVEQPSFWRF